MQSADMTGDDLPDVIISTCDQDLADECLDARVVVFPYEGAGMFGNAIERSVAPFPVRLLVADFELDGAPDVAALHLPAAPQAGGAHLISVLFNDPAQGIGLATEYDAWNGIGYSFGLAAGDVSGNDRPDLVFTQHLATPPRGPQAGFLPNDPGPFGAPLDLDVPGLAPSNIHVADIDGDGRCEVITINNGVDGSDPISVGVLDVDPLSPIATDPGEAVEEPDLDEIVPTSGPRRAKAKVTRGRKTRR